MKTVVNIERVMIERNNYFNEQHGIKRKEDHQENFPLQSHMGGLRGATIATAMDAKASTPTIGQDDLQCL